MSKQYYWNELCFSKSECVGRRVAPRINSDCLCMAVGSTEDSMAERWRGQWLEALEKHKEWKKGAIRISYTFAFLHLKSDIGLCIIHVSFKAEVERHFQIMNRFQGSVKHNQAKILFLNVFHFIPVSVVLALQYFWKSKCKGFENPH